MQSCIQFGSLFHVCGETAPHIHYLIIRNSCYISEQTPLLLSDCPSTQGKEDSHIYGQLIPERVGQRLTSFCHAKSFPQCSCQTNNPLLQLELLKDSSHPKSLVITVFVTCDWYDRLQIEEDPPSQYGPFINHCPGLYLRISGLKLQQPAHRDNVLPTRPADVVDARHRTTYARQVPV